jgi:hypothetical protein
MGRSEARVFTSIWRDEDWRALSRNARSTYIQLLTQEDLTHCGVITLREPLWATQAGVSEDEICQDLEELESVGWIVTDHGTRELFVRSLIRRDKALRQPKLWVPLSTSITQVWSTRIRAVLLDELVRTRAEGEVNRGIAGKLDELISDLKEQVNRVSGRHLASVSGTEPGSESDRETDRETDRHARSLQGLGERNGSSTTVAPSPVPPPPPHPAGPASDAAAEPAAAEVNAEGEGDLESLIAKIRAARPDWSATSIRRALVNTDVADRPWPLVWRAALAVAADPESQQPGRLARDGPWWHQPPAEHVVPSQPWCGQCAPNRRVEDAEGRDIGPCPVCHPSKARAS